MNITLIGMPGSGKSFVGEKLAKSLGLIFVDPDKNLEKVHGKSLQEIVDSLGIDAFLRAEADISVASVESENNILLSTGGSIVYSEEAVEELSRRSTIIYLEVGLETVQQRIGNAPRGIVGLENKTIEELFRERTLLYEKWASITVDGSQGAEKVVEDILSKLDSAKVHQVY